MRDDVRQYPPTLELHTLEAGNVVLEVCNTVVDAEAQGDGGQVGRIQTITASPPEGAPVGLHRAAARDALGGAEVDAEAGDDDEQHDAEGAELEGQEGVVEGAALVGLGMAADVKEQHAEGGQAAENVNRHEPTARRGRRCA